MAQSEVFMNKGALVHDFFELRSPKCTTDREPKRNVLNGIQPPKFPTAYQGEYNLITIRVHPLKNPPSQLFKFQINKK